MIKQPFYLICGYGDTGSLLAHEMVETGIQSVVIDIKQERIDVLEIEEQDMYIPGLCANAGFPATLELAGLKHPYCKGVVALTDQDQVNLKIAIAAKLLNPGLVVICRAESHETVANMSSFGTNYIINPFERFARRLALAVRSSSAFLIYEWLTNPRHQIREEPLKPPKGHWLLCGYGRFGKELDHYLRREGIRTTIVEADLEKTSAPEDAVQGRGTEAITLAAAGVDNATGIVAGTDHDANNLSIIVTATELNPTLFTIARQNFRRNESIFNAASLDYIMQPGTIIAGEILSIIRTPLLSSFLNHAREKEEQWANVVISRIASFIENNILNSWMLVINEAEAPALLEEFKQGKAVKLDDILRNPCNRDKQLDCLVLLIESKVENNTKEFVLPNDSHQLSKGDKILLCGSKESQKLLNWTVLNYNVYNYTHTGIELPGGFIWRWLYNMKNENAQ